MGQPIETQVKDGVAWPVGGQTDVDWITEGTEGGRRITAAIPPLFAAYATLTNQQGAPGLPREPGVPGSPRDVGLERRQDLAFVEVLHRHSSDKAWWIGYLDTGASDIVFWDAPKVTLYYGWRYVFVLAGPDQAAAWRPPPGGQPNWKSTELPEVMFPEDRSWLVSFLWDDDWACIGGSEALIRDLLSAPVLAPNARRVDTQQDATPPGDWPG
jgi:hypothetical protein